MTVRDAAGINRIMNMHVTTIDKLSADEWEQRVTEDAEDEAYETYRQTQRSEW